MAISKIILNGVTQMDLTGDTVAAGNLVSPNTAHGADGQAVAGSVQTQAGRTITPTTYQQTAVAANRYTTGAVYVQGDANLIPENIAAGVTIFNVTGTHSGGGGGGNVIMETITLYSNNETTWTGQTEYLTGEMMGALANVLTTSYLNAYAVDIEDISMSMPGYCTSGEFGATLQFDDVWGGGGTLAGTIDNSGAISLESSIYGEPYRLSSVQLTLLGLVL